MLKIKKDNKFALRVKSLGALGELIAIKVLVDNDFEKIHNLNDQKKNFPYGDLYAEQDGARYVISVKSRNKYQRNGKINSRYKLGERCYERAEIASHKYNAISCGWLFNLMEINILYILGVFPSLMETKEFRWGLLIFQNINV